MKIIVVGCGRLGAELSYRLYQRGQDVAVIDNNDGSFANLPPSFQGRTIEGEALNRDVLHRAGIKEADALAAVTNSDPVNAVVGHVASKYYQIPNVVVRNYIPNMRSIFETFKLQVVSSAIWGAQRLEEMIYHVDARTVFSAGNGEVEFYEICVPENWQGQTIKALVEDVDDCLVASVTRAGVAKLPRSEMTLEFNDMLHVSATFEGIERLRSKLFSTLEEV